MGMTWNLVVPDCTFASVESDKFNAKRGTSQLMCSSVQAALFEEEEKSRKLQDRLSVAERRNRQLKERVKKVKRSLKNARKATQKAEEELRELQERLVAAERRAGHHLNAIAQPQSPTYKSRGDRQQMKL